MRYLRNPVSTLGCQAPNCVQQLGCIASRSGMNVCLSGPIGDAVRPSTMSLDKQ